MRSSTRGRPGRRRERGERRETRNPSRTLPSGGNPREGRTGRRALVGLAATLLALLAPPGLAAGEPLQVWALSSWTRALRSDLPGTARSATLYAARNEWESFQVALRSERPLRIMALDVTPLRAEKGESIPAECLRRYRAHQLHIEQGTFRNEEFREGWYPDALIPLEAAADGRPPAGVSPRYRALPLELPPGETHTFWIDVQVPESATEETYRGEVRIEARDGGEPGREIVGTLAVELHVWPFALPRALAMKTELGSPAARILGWCRTEAERGRLEEIPDRARLYARCAKLETDHRVNSHVPPELMPERPGPDGTFELTSEQVAGWRAFLERYHVNALPVPPPHRYFKDPEGDREAIARYLRGWDGVLEAIGRPDLLCYTYLIDEPNDPEAYRFTRAWGQAVRQAGSRVRVLVTEQTSSQDEAWGDLHGAIDIWVPLFSLFEPDSAAKRRALGEEIWTYTALCQGRPTPWWHTDFPLYHYRIPTWMAWQHHMTGILYWGGMAHWRDVDDPWIEPGTYPAKPSAPDGKRPRVYNGEGTLLYPGWACGVDGPVASMRLKALRDGIEDFEYLTMLDSLGRRPVADALIRPAVDGWYEWSPDPERYLHIRRKLGCLIRDALKKRDDSGSPSPADS